MQSDTSAVRKTPCTGSLLEVKLVPVVYSRDKQHRTNQIKKGGSKEKHRIPFTKGHISNEKVKEDYAFSTLSTNYSKDIPFR